MRRGVWTVCLVTCLVVNVFSGCGKPNADQENDSDTGISPDSAADGRNDMAGPADQEPPTVRFETPTEGERHWGSTPVRLSVMDDTGVDRATIGVFGEVRAELTSAPWSWTWETSDLMSGEYVLTAEVRDHAGHSSTASTEVAIRPPCGGDSDCPPTDVDIVSPVENADVCGRVVVQSNASDDRKIDRVEFSVAQETIGTATSRPFTVNWNTREFPNGKLRIRATAVDNSGQSYFVTRQVTVSNTNKRCANGPSVRITKPSPKAFVNGTVPVQASASDETGVVHTQFFVDNARLVKDTTVPYRAQWDTDEFNEGTHSLKAIATNTSEQTAQHQLVVTVDRTPPSIRINTPSPGATKHGSVGLRAAASDNFKVARVEFRVDRGKWAKSVVGADAGVDLDLSQFSSGPHDLRVVATDGAGLTSSKFRKFIVDRPPEVTIQSPADGATITQSFDISITPSDDLGIDEKRLFVGQKLLGDFGPKNQLRWTPGQTRQGRQTLTVEVTDRAGQKVTEDVEVDVDCEQTWHRDQDRDGYGAPSKTHSKKTCKPQPPSGYVSNGSDCDDSSSKAHPGAAKRDSTTKCMIDSDGDGYGDANPPTGVASGTDCDDASKVKFKNWLAYRDRDGDGFGAGSKQTVCGGAQLPDGWATKNGDCDDSSGATYPGAALKDGGNKCMKDADGDGYGESSPSAGVHPGTDCDDSTPTKFKSWSLYRDRDADGYGTGTKQTVCGGSTLPKGWSKNSADCDDRSRKTRPSAAPRDDGSKCMKDADGDGFGDRSVAAPISKGTDCSDGDASINPNAKETCDSADNDCDDIVDEGCQCKYGGISKGVCSNGTVSPASGTCSAPRLYEKNEGSCDDKDNDCDGVVDGWAAGCKEARLVGDSGHDTAEDVVTDKSGNVYITGGTSTSLDGQPFNGGNRDAYLAKFDHQGVLKWVRLIGSSTYDSPTALAIGGAGNIYVGGQTRNGLGGQGPNQGKLDGFIVKYNPSGKQMWAQVLGTPQREMIWDIAATAAGDVYVSGAADTSLSGETYHGGSEDALLAKYDSTGKQQWVRLLGTNDFDRAWGVATNGSNDVYVVGRTKKGFGGQTYNGGTNDAFLAKYDGNGKRKWVRLFGGYGRDIGWHVAATTKGDVYITGSVDQTVAGQKYNGGNADGFLAAYDAAGSLQWARLFGSSKYEFGRRVVADGGSIYLTGQTTGSWGGQTYAGGKQDGYVAKFSGAGTQKWVRQVGTPRDDRAEGIAVGRTGAVFAAGRTNMRFQNQKYNGGKWDGFVAKVK